MLEELYLLELGLALRREGRAREAAIPIAGDGRRAGAAIAKLPFRLTRAQQRVWVELRADLARPHPMQRLLEGDVGSGKTVVALLAAIAVAEAGCQSALMAPTELLAEQHERTLRRLRAGDARASRPCASRCSPPPFRARRRPRSGPSSRPARSTSWWERTRWSRRASGSTGSRWW